MIKYHCPRCKIDFFHEKPNINHKHRCGEFAYLEWGTEYEGVSEGDLEESGS